MAQKNKSKLSKTTNSKKTKKTKFSWATFFGKKSTKIIGFVIIFSLIGGVFLFKSFAESVSGSIQGENLTGSGQVLWEKGADYGGALKLSNNTPANGSLYTTAKSTTIKVRARAEYCRTAPQIYVTIDGKPALYASAYSGSYTDYTAEIPVAAGAHTVGVSLANPNWRTGRCARAVVVDVVKLIDNTPPPVVAADTTAPKVAISSPGANTTVTSGAVIKATASDNVAVSKVAFYISGQNSGNAVSTVTATPYNYTWDTTGVANGTYTLSAKAYDAVGNVGSSSNIIVTVNNSKATVPTPPPASPPTASSVSGEAMPVGNIAGWKQVFSDDFATNVPVGGFSNCSTSSYTCSGLPANVAAKWWAYPDGWKDTSKNGTYYPSKVMSINGGVMNLNLHTENGVHMVSAPLPKAISSVNGQLYGRYAVRFKADPVPGYKTAWLLWPDSYTWPRDGEIDFPEGDLTGTIGAFMHKQNASSGSDQAAFGSSVTYTSWHTAVLEWSPGKCTFILDGKVIGTATDRVPNTPMHWVLQTETQLGGGAPSSTAAGNVQIDWVSVYAPM